MKYEYKSCILLTACVNPNGMSHTVLQNSNTRLAQYKEALDFYLKETNLPVVFCENTMYDISAEYKEWIDLGRLEVITFNGNNYDKQRGKGYGEAVIMKYAIEQSEIIKKSKYMIKITGRLIITDIKRLAFSRLFCMDNLFRSNIKNQFISTYLIIARPELIRKFVDKYQEQIWEDHSTNDLIEHHFYRALTKDGDFNKTTFIPFLCIPKVVGVSGTTGELYSMDDRLIGNCVYTYYFKKDRNCKLFATPYLIAYYILLFIDKLKVRIGLKEKSYF